MYAFTTTVSRGVAHIITQDRYLRKRVPQKLSLIGKQPLRKMFVYECNFFRIGNNSNEA